MAQLIYIQVENGVVARPLVYVSDRIRAPGSAAYAIKMAALHLNSEPQYSDADWSF